MPTTLLFSLAFSLAVSPLVTLLGYLNEVGHLHYSYLLRVSMPTTLQLSLPPYLRLPSSTSFVTPLSM